MAKAIGEAIKVWLKAPYHKTVWTWVELTPEDVKLAREVTQGTLFFTLLNGVNSRERDPVYDIFEEVPGFERFILGEETDEFLKNNLLFAHEFKQAPALLKLVVLMLLFRPAEEVLRWLRESKLSLLRRAGYREPCRLLFKHLRGVEVEFEGRPLSDSTHAVCYVKRGRRMAYPLINRSRPDLDDPGLTVVPIDEVKAVPEPVYEGFCYRGWWKFARIKSVFWRDPQ